MAFLISPPNNAVTGVTDHAAAPIDRDLVSAGRNGQDFIARPYQPGTGPGGGGDGESSHAYAG